MARPEPSNRLERRIFATLDFERTVRERQAFGWLYVGQTAHTASDALGRPRETLFHVEMRRDTAHPGYPILAAEEARYFGAKPPPPVGGRAAKLLKLQRKYGAAIVPILAIAALSMVPPVEDRFQTATADWSGNQLSLLALGCIPLYIVAVGLTIKLQALLERPSQRRYQRAMEHYHTTRQGAMRRAATARGET